MSETLDNIAMEQDHQQEKRLEEIYRKMELVDEMYRALKGHVSRCGTCGGTGKVYGYGDIKGNLSYAECCICKRDRELIAKAEGKSPNNQTDGVASI